MNMEQHIVMKLREQILSARQLQEAGQEVEKRAHELLEMIQAIDFLNPGLLDSRQCNNRVLSNVENGSTTELSPRNAFSVMASDGLLQPIQSISDSVATSHPHESQTPPLRTPRRIKSRFVWTPEQTEKVIAMRTNGVPLEDIAREFGRTKEQIRDHWRYTTGRKK